MADMSALDTAYAKGHELGRAAAEAEVQALREALWESATGRHYMNHTNQLPDAAFTDFNICTFSFCIAARALVPEPPEGD